ncbi:hypothetical protein [Actinospongicola halichondriae]|uniref:hypothetical protein n=1 Tax=Actinospongicola halichondriae TaxID=3236844 RepID=UPI003D4EFF99
MQRPTLTFRFFHLVAAFALVFVAACGGDDSSADDADDRETTTTEDDTTETTEAPDTTLAEPEPEPAEDAVRGAEADPTAVLLGDKAILLDGFFGVRIPDGWEVSTAVVPEPSVSPAGGETEVDTDAIEQVLVIGPAADPRAATFALLHYTHSDSVPDLERFTDGIKGVLGADGTQFTEGQSASIGGQDAILHQLQTPDGDNGLFVSMHAGDEYFFIVSIVSDDSYAAGTADMLSSVSVVPAAIR